MQYRIMKLLAVLALASGLAACGLSPQQARPEPRLSGQLAKVAAGQRVSVHISDGRSSPVLGSRGGLYGDSNALSVEGRTFMPRLQAEVEAGLRMRGFDIQPQGQAPATFDLQVTGLTYAVTEGRTVMSDVQLDGNLSGPVAQGWPQLRGQLHCQAEKEIRQAANRQSQRPVGQHGHE